ncbi:MAG: hypothetical protein A2Y82_00415 [Candidatus Buchananbacteria bacterium RBG_13_36_9]|uniref:Uncharacterized protein n=1 Tax=Candidatus Buchananbacteria bacterium RBG_13_36_9 TaxID=1797530 RepID=A0A1G1XRD8_9BACT|nr:MAG: hypothetical protein A2Y82_00415 [Candidatus Buchananbacteria bacterium RBG_13_36_9]
MAHNNPHKVYLEAISQIKKIINFRTTSGNWYLMVIFKEKEWIEYFRKELFFTLNGTDKFFAFTEMPTCVLNNALIMRLEGECENMMPFKIGIFGPPEGDNIILEAQLEVLTETKS